MCMDNCDITEREKCTKVRRLYDAEMCSDVRWVGVSCAYVHVCVKAHWVGAVNTYRHMLTGLHWLEANERDLHRKDGPQHIHL